MPTFDSNHTNLVSLECRWISDIDDFNWSFILLTFNSNSEAPYWEPVAESDDILDLSFYCTGRAIWF